jgi:hypothetical protein
MGTSSSEKEKGEMKERTSGDSGPAVTRPSSPRGT